MIIGLSGPNAIGKTTAVRRWCLRYPSLIAALADNQRETTGADWEKVLSSPPNLHTWKHDIKEKEERVEYHRSADSITVIDSARTTCLNFFLPGEPILLVTCSWEAMERNLRERCEKSEKTYRADYWDRKKLEYESSRRYLGWRQKYTNLDAKAFSIEDREKDWEAVDDYFGSLYRRLNNLLVKRRRK